MEVLKMKNSFIFDKPCTIGTGDGGPKFLVFIFQGPTERDFSQGQYVPGPDTSFARILRGAAFFLWNFNYALQNFQ